MEREVYNKVEGGRVGAIVQIQHKEKRTLKVCVKVCVSTASC